MTSSDNAAPKASRRTAALKALAWVGRTGLCFGGALFLSAGRLHWPAAWALLGILLAYFLTTLWTMEPGLILERTARGRREGRPFWDVVVSRLAFDVGPLLSMVLSGLDVRMGWSTFPAGLQVAAGVAMAAGLAFSAWATRANRFFSASVRIQADRGHQVATGGPYRFVRHPGYVGFILYVGLIPMLLGSWWACIGGAFSAGGIVLRTALEDRMLRKELPGYEEYARSVRYRLLPGVW